MRLEPGGIIILVGRIENMARFTDVCAGTTALRRQGPYLIAGSGEGGCKVAELLHDAGEETRIISWNSGPGIDSVGNVLDPEVLKKVGVKDAQAVVLALSEDAVPFLPQSSSKISPRTCR